MKLAFDITQIVLGLLLIAAILLQSSGSGLGSAFGGGESITNTRRGAEKGLFNFTIVLAVLFIGVSLVRIIIL